MTIAPRAQRWLVALVFLLLGEAYLGWTWSTEIADFQGDSSEYMLAARVFSPFWESSPVLTDFAHQIYYPPLFPLLIAAFGASILAGHLVVAVSLLLALACLYQWMRGEGLGGAAAIGCVLVFALMPGTYLQALHIWTENTFLLCSLIAIWLVSAAERRGASAAFDWWLAAAAVACGCLTRVAGLPLLVAFVLRVLWLRPPRWIGLLAAAGLPFGAWCVWNKLQQAGVGGYTSQWAALYGSGWMMVLARQLHVETVMLLRAWVQAWTGATYSAPLLWITIGLGALALVGWLRRGVALRFDALYVSIYLLLLLAWPHPEEAARYSYVIVPILLAQGLIYAAQPGPASRVAPGLVLGVCMILVLPSLLLNAQRFFTPLPAGAESARRAEWWYQPDPLRARFDAQLFAFMLADLRHLGEKIPPSDCVFAIKPPLVELYSGRIARLPPVPATSDKVFAEGMRACGFAYAINPSSPTYLPAYYPVERLRSPDIVYALRNPENASVPFALLLRLPR